MDIVELATYACKWWYFTLICFSLDLMARTRCNARAPLLSRNILHRKFVETVLTLYTRAFVSLRNSMIGMVFFSACLSSIYYLRDMSVCSCCLHITEHLNYDTINVER